MLKIKFKIIFANNRLFFWLCARAGKIQRKQLFDYNWKFFLGDTAAASLNNFDDRNWRILDLPHDWSIEGRLSPKNSVGRNGGYFPQGIGWYKKAFTVSFDWKGKNVSKYFEGVYMNSEVFINGKSTGVYRYGYSFFSYDKTKVIISTCSVIMPTTII